MTFSRRHPWTRWTVRGVAIVALAVGGTAPGHDLAGFGGTVTLAGQSTPAPPPPPNPGAS